MGKMRERSAWLRVPSPAMTVACISLAVALSGASYAAVVLPRNGVGTIQLKRGAVTSIKIKNNAVTGADVLESSLAKVRFAKTADTATSVGADAVGSVNVVNASSEAGLRKADIAAVVTTVTFDPPSIAANSCGLALGVVPGAQLGDSIVLQPTAGTWGNLAWMPWLVNSANSVAIRVCNPTTQPPTRPGHLSGLAPSLTKLESGRAASDTQLNENQGTPPHGRARTLSWFSR